jgi:hypothetical protein
VRTIFDIDIFIKNTTREYKKTNTNNMIKSPESMKKTTTSIMIGKMNNGMVEGTTNVM